MADNNLNKVQNASTLNLSLTRGKNYGPLDISNVFYSENDFKWYLSYSSSNPNGTDNKYTPSDAVKNSDNEIAFVPHPYEGQIIAVKGTDGIHVYVLGAEKETADSTTGLYFDYAELATGGSVATDLSSVQALIYGAAGTSAAPADGSIMKDVDNLQSSMTTAEADIDAAEADIDALEALHAKVGGDGDDADNFKTVAQEVAAGINALDVAAAAVATIGTGDNENIVTIHSIKEEDGKIAIDDAGVSLAKVAKTGAAEDVALADSGNHTTQTTVEGAISEIYGKIETLNADADTEGSVKKEVATAVAGIVNGASESYDTLKEIADWIASDTTGAASMANDISALKTQVGKEATTGDNPTAATGLVADIRDLETLTAGNFTAGTGDNQTTTIKGYIDNKVANVADNLGDLAVLDEVAESDLAEALASKINGKADKVASATNGNFAGLDANGNLTDSGSKAADFATAAQGTKADSAIQSVKVNGSALTADANKAVDILVEESANNGKIKVNGTDVAIHGLGSAAYTESSAYDAAGAAAAVLGESTDASTANTVYGAKKLANEVLGISSDASTANTVYGAKAAAAAAQSTADTNAAAITILNGASTVAGSVAKAVANEASRIDAITGTPDSGKTLQGEIDALEEIVGTTSVASQISTAIGGLDATVSISDTESINPLNITIKEVDGKLTEVSGSIDANTFDAYGAASTAKSEIMGSSTDDTASSKTIEGLVKKTDATNTAVSALQATHAKVGGDGADKDNYKTVAQEITAGINALDVTDTAVDHQFVTAVSETDGKVSISRAALAAADIPTLAISKIDGLQDALDGKQASITDGSAIIASVSNNVVTIKAGVAQSAGAIANSSDTDIVLEEVAKTGAAADVSIADANGRITATTVEGALDEIASNVAANTSAIGASTNPADGTIRARLNTLESDLNTASTGVKARLTAAENDIDTLQGQISGVFHYKGSATKTGSNLFVDVGDTPTQVTNPTIGDVYSLSNGEEWAWDGTEWILLGTTTDLSNYYNKTQIDSMVGGISGALTFKGVLNDNQFDANGLPTITGMSNGDVYLNSEGEQFAYNGTNWVKLGYTTDLSAYSTTSQVQNMIDGAVTGLYKFKGSVATMADLYAITTHDRGDVYVVTENSKQYAWSTNEWVEISTNVDLSDYAKTADVNSAIATAKAAAISTAAADADIEREAAKTYADTLVNAVKAGTGETWSSDMTLASMDSRLDALEATIDTDDTGLTDQITAINNKLADDGDIGSRIVALETIDHSHDNKTTLDGITDAKVTAWDAAEANVLEAVKIGDSALTITDKAVTIPVFSSSTSGLVPVVGSELNTTALKQKAFLNANGEWAVPTDARIGDLTISSTQYSTVEAFVEAAIENALTWSPIA